MIAFLQVPVDEIVGVQTDKFIEITENVKHLSEAFDTVMSANSGFIGIFTRITGLLCAAFLMLNFIKKIANPDTDANGVLQPVGIKFIIVNITAILAILLYKELFYFAEKGMVLISNGVIDATGDNAGSIQKDLIICYFTNVARDFAAQLAAAATNFSIFGFEFGGLGEAAAAFLKPNTYAYAFSAIAMIIGFANYLLLYMAYMDRSLILLVLNVIAPFVFTLAVLDKFKDITTKFFTVLITTFLIFPFILLGFQVIDYMYLKLCSAYGLVSTLLNNGSNTDLSSLEQLAKEGVAITAEAVAKIFNYDPFIKLPLICFSIFLKLKYSQLISSTVWKIMH
ncbi:MAG: hypothetical protein LBG96_16255 [Tannerella sp.]|jgi:hypothetical protein|nr:hypothetical protein [Tannerella sp.]